MAGKPKKKSENKPKKSKISPQNQEKTKVLPYKTSTINNRRYLGNKYKLLPFIRKVTQEHCSNIQVVADIFAGTGAVSSAFLDKKIITNDIMYSNYLCHVAWFGTETFSQQKIVDFVAEYNAVHPGKENYMSENFTNTFFSGEDCRKIGWIRQDIQEKYEKNSLNHREQALLLTSLLYAADKIANTCGHYDAYRRGVVFSKELELTVPLPQEKIHPENQNFNLDANILVKNIQADLVYIDPPYNSRQYCDAYHVLENIARWEKPEVFGVARKMDRTKLKSDYCTKKAARAFENLVDGINSRYILLSYNNMKEKGNERSNAKISDQDILRILSQKGKVTIFSEDHKQFSAGKSTVRANQERLFLCECHEK